MAHTEHLPTYNASYALCLYLEQVVRQFSRYHKYTLGSDLCDGSRRVLKYIVRANARSDKTAVLPDCRQRPPAGFGFETGCRKFLSVDL